MGLDVLIHGGICRIILHYLRSPDGLIRAQYRNDPLRLGPRAADRNHLLLFKEGIIENANHPTQLRFKLTEKGKQVATKLNEIEDLMKK
jgi:hypothetical protein